jgi:hypothetical protein
MAPWPIDLTRPSEDDLVELNPRIIERLRRAARGLTNTPESSPPPAPKRSVNSTLTVGVSWGALDERPAARKSATVFRTGGCLKAVATAVLPRTTAAPSWSSPIRASSSGVQATLPEALRRKALDEKTVGLHGARRTHSGAPLVTPVVRSGRDNYRDRRAGLPHP